MHNNLIDRIVHKEDIVKNAQWSLNEDIRKEDISAKIIPNNIHSNAQVISRDNAILCGTHWFDCVFKLLNKDVKIQWNVTDGDKIHANQIICSITGHARSILTAERSALNFLQTLSGTATTTHAMVNLIKHTNAKLLDTRKTLPGLRTAQKYAVLCGGGNNHRLDLNDFYLLKENHIRAGGGIHSVITQARLLHPNTKIEIEVSNIEELQHAIEAQADIIMLDNFSMDQIQAAVKYNNQKCKLEVSGNITIDNIKQIAETGVDLISTGIITKNCVAIDLSLLINS